MATWDLPPGTRAYYGEDKVGINGRFKPLGDFSYTLFWQRETTPEERAASGESKYEFFLFANSSDTREELIARMASTTDPEKLDWEAFRRSITSPEYRERYQETQPIAETDTGELFPFGFNEPAPTEEEPQRLSLWDQLEQQIANIGTAFGRTARAIRDYFGY